jgi:DNA ligase-1
MAEDDPDIEAKPMVDKSDGVSRKRSRTPPSSTAEAEEPKIKEEKVKDEEDDDDEPVLKRARRNGKGGQEAVPKPAPKVQSRPEQKSKPLPPKEEEDVEEDRSASASESEAEGAEEEEDEKPEVAAKAREKIQTTLKSNTKDPYPDWKPGEPVPYAALCTTFSLIEMTSKRLIMTAHCSLFLRQVLRLTPDDLLPTVLLMINKLAADYAGIELGI